MGYLHAGHLSLFRAAAAQNDVAVASIFVNPTQFAPSEDLDSYPRDLEGDTAKAEADGIDLLWVPADGEVYSADHTTTVSVDGVTAGLCGASRPGHFAGVATVVAKLFNLVQPTRAYFGEKDFQQLAVIRRMVRDLDFAVEIVGMPIVRDADGVAVSSRNAYLRSDERAAAVLLSRSLERAETLFRTGERDPAVLHKVIARTIEESRLPQLEYAELVDPSSLTPIETEITGPVLIALAARFGRTRLIDNRVLEP
jgi:pantoate--beta-alanine ligase